MATYIIGDIQGCYVELQLLLQKINFNPDRDQLGFVGDLVNRGPESSNVLRFIKSLKNPIVVLGNHDLYALILGFGLMPLDSYQHNLHELINSYDRAELLDWLRHQAFLHFDKKQNQLFVHAGIPPQWPITKSIQHAKEVESMLQGAHFKQYLLHLFGNQPATWDDNLSGQARLRYITNAFTRMRYCTEKGELDFLAQRNSDVSDDRFKPWFQWRNPKETSEIYFGHWAHLNGKCDQPNTYALDTGCAWGHELTAIRLEDKKRFSVPAVK